MEDKLKEFNELRENAPEEPRACNQCDAMQIHERHIAKTSVEKGTRLVLMHEDGFVFRDRALVIRSEFCITP